MKILIAPDSFKGALSAREAADAMAAGIKRALPHAEVFKVPLADGGEGTVDTLVTATGGSLISLTVKDPFLRDVTASYGILGDKSTAVIEMAAASGLALLENAELDPLAASSYGTGQLIKSALDRGCQKIIIGLGGSAVNDGGLGMLSALGARFYNESGGDSSIGGQGLLDLAAIDFSNLDNRLAPIDFIAACDVKNPLTGPEGATYIFGPQKGVTGSMLETLDKAMARYAKMVAALTGVKTEQIPGAGAAGGLGAAVCAFLGGEIRSGIELVMEVTELKKQMERVDLVFTGEGRIDVQTSWGKALWGLAQMAQKFQVPMIALTGSIGTGTEMLFKNGFTGIFAIADGPLTLEESIRNSAPLLESSAYRISLLIDSLYKIYIPDNK